MRGRMVGIIAGAAVLWTVAPLSASATGCEANVDTSIAVPGDKSASVEGGCENLPTSGGASATVKSDDDGLTVGGHHRMDLDGDGDNETSDGSFNGSFDCPPPEEQGVVKSVVCSVLQAT